MRKVTALLLATGLAFGLTASVAPHASATVWCKPVKGSC